MLAFLASLAFASPTVEPPALDAAYDTVYVAGVELTWVHGWFDPGSGLWVDGYWRPSIRPGYAWVEPGYDLSGIWLPGRWVSVVPAVIRAPMIYAAPRVYTTVAVPTPRVVRHRRVRR